MGALQDFFQRLNELFNIVTDWLLIGIGLALVIKSVLAIDVPLAKYMVIGAGSALIVLGFWYRYRRKNGTGEKSK